MNANAISNPDAVKEYKRLLSLLREWHPRNYTRFIGAFKAGRKFKSANFFDPITQTTRFLECN